jgi:diketogulonate reductase-like aldo/keto reductase
MTELTLSAAAAGTFVIGGDLTVNRMGYGAMRITGPGIWGPPADKNAVLATPAKEAHEAIKKVSSDLRATPLQVALAWLLKRSRVILPIPGTSSVKHLDENIAAGALELPQSAYDELSAVSVPPASLRG